MRGIAARRNRRTRRTRRTVLVAVLCATAVTAVPLAGTAEAKKKGKSYAGRYTGPTEYFGTVSFTLTRAGKILDFQITNATMECKITPSGPEYDKVVTITHGPMQMQKISKKNPQGKKFEVNDPYSDFVASAGGSNYGGVLELTSGPGGGRVLPTRGFNGESFYTTNDGPLATPGTEVCGTKLIDWEAKRPGDKGFVSVGASGHLRPPLSEFSAGGL